MRLHFHILSVFFHTKQYNKMEGTLVGVNQGHSSEEDILAELGRRTGPGRILKLRFFMTFTADQMLFEL